MTSSERPMSPCIDSRCVCFSRASRDDENRRRQSSAYKRKMVSRFTLHSTRRIYFLFYRSTALWLVLDAACALTDRSLRNERFSLARTVALTNDSFAENVVPRAPRRYDAQQCTQRNGKPRRGANENENENRTMIDGRCYCFIASALTPSVGVLLLFALAVPIAITSLRLRRSSTAIVSCARITKNVRAIKLVALTFERRTHIRIRSVHRWNVRSPALAAYFRPCSACTSKTARQ